MSSPAPTPQHEPTMEEILASIRKIISEDQAEPSKPAAQPVPLRPHPPEPAPAAVAEADVLELTDEVHDEEPAPAELEPQPAPVAENDVAFETIEPPPVAEEPVAEPDTDDLISSSTRSAVSRAFANMDKGPVEYTPPGNGTIEAIFVQAVQNAFQPTLQDWVDGHNAEIMDSLKPLIRAWMDEHLPALIEAALAKELGRASAERRRR